jgi:hypothetical protein
MTFSSLGLQRENGSQKATVYATTGFNWTTMVAKITNRAYGFWELISKPKCKNWGIAISYWISPSSLNLKMIRGGWVGFPCEFFAIALQLNSDKLRQSTD